MGTDLSTEKRSSNGALIPPRFTDGRQSLEEISRRLQSTSPQVAADVNKLNHLILGGRATKISANLQDITTNPLPNESTVKFGNNKLDGVEIAPRVALVNLALLGKCGSGSNTWGVLAKSETNPNIVLVFPLARMSSDNFKPLMSNPNVLASPPEELIESLKELAQLGAFRVDSR